MNSRQRVMAVLDGKKADRLPNLNILMLYLARELGVPYGKMARDYRLLVEGNLLCAEKYGLDCVTVMCDSYSEGHDLGGNVVFPEDDVPYMAEPLIKKPGDLLRIRPIDPSNGRRMSNIVNAVALYRRRVGGEFPVIGWVEGCFAQAADLMGVTEFLMALADEEAQDFLLDVLELVYEQELRYARAQVEAGADIIGVGDAIASVAGPVHYKKLARGYEERLLREIKAMGVRTKLHICGNIQPFLSDIPIEYCDIIDVDHMVSLEEAARLYQGKCALTGNYDPVGVLLQGTPASVDAAVRHCAHIGGPRYMTAAGCEVPRATPPENLMQVKRTLDELC